jgi:penicillin amidase
VSGRVPVRNKGGGDVPVPGWTGEFDWISEISHNDMPHVLNPKCGYVISCNNKITDDSYPYYLGNSFMNGYRAARIEDKFKGLSKIDFQLVQDLHMDFHSIPGKRIKDGLISGLRTAKPKAQKLIDILDKWDNNLDEESIGGTVYQVFLFRLIKNIVQPHLGQTLTEKYLGIGDHPLLLPVNELLGHSTEAVIRIFQNPDSRWVPSGIWILENTNHSLSTVTQQFIYRQ